MDNNKASTNSSGPLKAGRLTITVDRNLCIGAATCVAVAPKTFALDNEAKAIILDTASQDSEQAIIDGAKACPVAAITILNESGKQIYP